MMERLNILLKHLKDKFYCKDIMVNQNMMKSNEKNTSAKKNKKVENKTSSAFFCYNLCISIMLIILFYFLQIGYMMASAQAVYRFCDMGLYLSEKHEYLQRIFAYQLVTYNAYQQKLIFGDRFNITGLKTDDGISKLLARYEEITTITFNLDKASEDNHQPYVRTETYLNKISKTSICEFSSDLS